MRLREQLRIYALQCESIPQLMMNETTENFMPAKIKFNKREAKKRFSIENSNEREKVHVRDQQIFSEF